MHPSHLLASSAVAASHLCGKMTTVLIGVRVNEVATRNLAVVGLELVTMPFS